MKQKNKVIKFLASLKLAVIILISFSVIIAVGTIVESRFDAIAAKKLVYDTFWMYFIMIALIVNLTAVIVDRWPWQKRHMSFIFAHVGIIILLFGGFLTMQWGLDGSMRIPIGGKSSFVTTQDTEINVYSSFDGDRYTRIFGSAVDFFRKHPTTENPFIIPALDTELKIIDYKDYVLPNRKVKPDTDKKMGSALRFQIRNDRVNVVEWLVQKRKGALAQQNFGPAKVFLGEIPKSGDGTNSIYFNPVSDTKIEYATFKKDSDKVFKKGVLEEGSEFDTGWMGLVVKVLRFYPIAKEEWDVEVKDRPTPLTTPAIKIKFNDKERWALLNDTLQFFTDNAVYILNYGNSQIDLKSQFGNDFNVELKNFEIDRYQGTMRAMAYKSFVSLPGIEKAEISMNEPLKYNGLTFYQSSFQEDPPGRPIASIFSVNHDPGRPLKYIGSILISLGIIMLFWFKKIGTKKN